MRAEVERREVELPGKVKAIVQDALDRNRARHPSPGLRHRPLRSPPNNGPAVSSHPIGGDDSAYLLARRSLRLWPVSREGDLDTRTREFLVNELLLDQQYAASLTFTVKRTAGPGRARDKEATAAARVKDEVLVAFENIRERDDVRSHAKNLEKKGRGLRLEVPDSLWPSFRVLQNLGYELKQKNPALRRNVLFDDTARDLKLDFSNDGTNSRLENPWQNAGPLGLESLQSQRPS